LVVDGCRADSALDDCSSADYQAEAAQRVHSFRDVRLPVNSPQAGFRDDFPRAAMAPVSQVEQ
jgi:hypothetical protein